MKIRSKKVYVLLEIDQSRYLDDEDYDGLDVAELKDRGFLARILEKDCSYPMRIRIKRRPSDDRKRFREWETRFWNEEFPDLAMGNDE